MVSSRTQPQNITIVTLKSNTSSPPHTHKFHSSYPPSLHFHLPMAITSISVTTFFFLLFFFISVEDAAYFFFNFAKRTAHTTVSKASPCLLTPSMVLILDFPPHEFGRNLRLCTIQNIHLSRKKIRNCKVEIYFLQSAIRDLNGGDKVENVRMIHSFMNKTSYFVVVDEVNLGHLPDLAVFSVKNLDPRTRLDKIVNLHLVLPRGIETSRLFIKTLSDLQKNEEQKHDSYMQLRRRVLQIATAAHELKEIVTVPSTFPGNTAAATAAAPATPTVTVPSTAPGANVPVMGGKVWCVGKKGIMEWKLQEALDYACGEGGADCTQIQAGGSCYNPNTVQNHASYALNMYYQKHPSPPSCDFSGAGEIITINPSTETCMYPSSLSSSPPPPPVEQSVMPWLPGTSTPPGMGSGGGGVSTSSTNLSTGSDNSLPQPSFLNSSSGNVVMRPNINIKLFVFLLPFLSSLFIAHHTCDVTIISVIRL